MPCIGLRPGGAGPWHAAGVLDAARCRTLAEQSSRLPAAVCRPGDRALFDAVVSLRVLIACGIVLQVARIVYSTRHREELRDETGDPRDGRSLEWMAALGVGGAFATFVVFAWRDVPDYVVPAAEVARIDRANRALRQAELRAAGAAS